MIDLLDQSQVHQGNSPSDEPNVLPSDFVPQFPEIIDSSMLSSLKTCETLFEKTYIQHWKAREASVHLHAGGAFAKGLEVARTAFWTGEYRWLRKFRVDEATNPPKLEANEQIVGRKVLTAELAELTVLSTEQRDLFDAESSIACGLQALLTTYGDFDCPEDSAKSASRMAGAFEFYFSNYPLDQSADEPIVLPSGRRGIEFSFAEPCDVRHPVTGNPILVVGRMDMLFHAFNGVFIEDDKTTTQLGASWSKQWNLRGQFSGYAWACKRSGINVNGAIIRGVSILKTKYDTQQAISYRPEWQLNRWYDEAMIWLERGIAAWKAGRWLHNLDHACAEFGGCAFREVCLSENEKPWLETNFERRVWNPLLREERKL
jgi:hypothetical protein